MRIIGGTYRGRKLFPPKDYEIRPTGDRVKEALFNILQMRIRGAEFLDVFAGSGAIGIEAISRGANSTFLESSNEAVKLIKQNLSLISSTARVIHGNSVDSIPMLYKQGARFDIIYIDPPYKSGLDTIVLQMLLKYPIINNNALIIVEHNCTRDITQDLKGYLVKDSRKYKDTCLTFLERLDDSSIRRDI